MKNPIIVIAGPTASGKTAMAVELAKKFNGEIINADSRSIYIGMDLGTGKPPFSCHPERTKDPGLDSSALPQNDEEEIAASSRCSVGAPRNDICYFDGIPHHLFDLITPDKTFSFMKYKELAQKKIKEIQSRGKIPFIVGGTGLYIDSVVYDFEPAGEPDLKLREELEKRDPELLYGLLSTFDPETAKTIDPKNKRRVIRALEIYEQTKEAKVKQEKRKEKPENVLYLALDVPREKLYENINKRVNVWMKEDFEEEVKKLLKKYPLNSPGLDGIGYKQIGLYLEEKISREEAISKFKQGDRNLAKRQLTWLKRNKDIVWIKDKKEALNKINSFIS